MRAWVIAAMLTAVATIAGGCVSGIPYCCAIVMPARYDVGVAPSSSRGATVVHMAAGMHLASGYPKQAAKGDVGIGYVLDVRDERADPTKPLATSRIARWVFGGYLEGAYRIGGGAHHRGFAGLRAEVLRAYDNGPAPTQTGFGLGARASWELDRAGKGRDWTGALAAGVFVETTARTFTGGLVEYTVVTGLTFRHPMVFVPIRRH